MKYTPAQLKKTILAVVGFAVNVAAAGLGGHLFPAGWEPYIIGSIGVAASYGVFAARNAPLTGVQR